MFLCLQSITRTEQILPQMLFVIIKYFESLILYFKQKASNL